jgi:hypothetical protein
MFGNIERKGPFEKRSWRTCEASTKMDLKEKGHESVECIICLRISVNAAGYTSAVQYFLVNLGSCEILSSNAVAYLARFTRKITFPFGASYSSDQDVTADSNCR